MELRSIGDHEIGLAKCWMEERIARRGYAMTLPDSLFTHRGASVYDGATCRCVVFMAYPEDLLTAFLGWVVTNPGNMKTESFRAVFQGIRCVVQESRNRGYKHVISLSECRGLNRMLDVFGFRDGDTAQVKMLNIQEI